MSNSRVWIPIVIFALIVVLAALSVVFFSGISASDSNSTALNSFAQCLSQKGAVMYGEYSCSHCQAQKALFGASFKYVNYVECTKDVDKCLAASVTSTPTWTYPNGGRYIGEQSLNDLASESGCVLPVATSSPSA